MIRFQPKRGLILFCDYDLANIPPEMRKKRRVIVVSPRSYNRLSYGRDGTIIGPGKCVVVPVSATEPRKLLKSHVTIPCGSYSSLTRDTWVICEMVSHVSFTRLDNYKREYISDTDMARIGTALQHALGV